MTSIGRDSAIIIEEHHMDAMEVRTETEVTEDLDLSIPGMDCLWYDDSGDYLDD